MLKGGVKGVAADIGAVATREGTSISVLAWHYHDDDLTSADATVTLEVGGFPADVQEALVRHYRVDPTHSNSYTAWKKMGSPQQPTAAQYAALEEAGSLQMFQSPQVSRVRDGKTTLMFSFPRQAVSLVRLSW
jgi:xylan 1,4-beta-xylosidase